MRDPHVVALHYHFESADTHHSFEGAQVLGGTLGDFDFELNDARLVARPRSHFADEESARAALEPHLRAWEQGTFLSEDMHITFKYAKTEIIDRDPVPGVTEVRPDPITLNAVLYAPTVILGHAAYPPPDPEFKVTPVTDRMSERIMRVRAGQASLPAEAYWVLTQLETEYGAGKYARKSVAERLNVEEKVLQTLGRLSAQGDPNVGRKADRIDAPLTEAEMAWLRAAIVRLARRVGESEGGATLTTVTMADLPPL